MNSTRYRTIGGAIVEITSATNGRNFDSECGGCSWTYFTTAAWVAEERAQQHAEQCRAMPR